MIIGLTGGIGSGKSTVAAILEEKGYQIIDADAISREVTAKGSPALLLLAKEFGEDIIFDNGTLNRKLLRERAFVSDEKHHILNSIITTRIIELSKQRFTNKCVYDAPTLLENGLQSIVDKVMIVTADRDIRVTRVVERDGMSRHDVLNIIAKQMPEEEKFKYADVVIYNNGTLEELKDAVNKALDVLEYSIGRNNTNG